MVQSMMHKVNCYVKYLLVLGSLLCVHAMGATLWAPMRTSQTLHAGEEIVIAIQNGQNPNQWYAIRPGVFPSNVLPVTCELGCLVDPPTSVKWRVRGSSPVKLQQGSYHLLNNAAGWSIPLAGTGPLRQFISTTSDTLIWRTNIRGKGVDYFNSSTGDTLLVNQIAGGLDLPTGSYAFQIFMRLPTFTFESGEYGYMNTDNLLMSSDANGNFTFPDCFAYSAANKFAGWSLTPNGPIEYQAGDEIRISPTALYSANTVYYAVFQHVDIPAQCFDFTDLYSPYTACYAGEQNDDYLRPLSQSVQRSDYKWTQGVFDEGGWSDYDHHIAVIADPNSYCPLLADSVKQVPDGFTSSVLLGNFQSGIGGNKSFAEAVDYSFKVDTSQNTILVIKYLPILEDSHARGSGVQLTIFDEFGNEINPTCSSFDFSLEGTTITGTMPGDPQWKTSERNSKYDDYSGGPFQYHDWATLGLDLGPYHGQVLVLRLFLHDCLLTGHMGCIYYAIRCEKKNIRSYACASDNGDFRLEAPDGFFYRWYTENDASTIISTSQSLLVPPSSEDRVFMCDCSVDEAFECAFTITSTLEYQIPVAQFEAEVKHGVCADTLWINNQSFLSLDGIHELNPHEDCDSVLWNFGDGRLLDGSIPNPRQYQWNEPIIYSSAGDKTIGLVACINNWDCLTDTAQFTFHVEAGKDVQVVYDTLCLGETLYVANEPFIATYAGDTVLTRIVTNACLTEGSLEQHIHIGQTYEVTEWRNICNGQSYWWRGKEYTIPGVYYDSLLTSVGCDSVLVLHLGEKVIDTISLHTTICPGETYIWDSRKYTEAGVYPYVYPTQSGCDSVVTLYLDTFPVIKTDTAVALCADQFPYTWHGHIFSTPTIYVDTLTSSYGCDSIVKLYLLLDKYCEIDHPLNPTIDCDTTYSTTDTIIAYDSLKIHPYQWFGQTYNEPGIYEDTLVAGNAQGCDSIGRLLLRVTYKDSIEVCGTTHEALTFDTPWGQHTLPANCDCLTGCLLESKDHECMVDGEVCVVYKTCECDTAYSTTYQQIQQSELPYTWNGIQVNEMPTASHDTTLIFNTIKLDASCDSIATLHLHIIGPCEFPTKFYPKYRRKED